MTTIAKEKVRLKQLQPLRTRFNSSKMSLKSAITDLKNIDFQEEPLVSGYEYANRIEETVPLPEKNELEIPLLFFMLTDVLVIFDHARQTYGLRERTN